MPTLIIPFLIRSELCSTFLASYPSLIHNPFSIFASYSLVLLGGSGGLLGLVATELLLGLGLDGLVGLLDGGSALDGGGAEVSTVRVLGSLVGNGLVGPEGSSMSAEFTCMSNKCNTMALYAVNTHLRLLLEPL